MNWKEFIEFVFEKDCRIREGEGEDGLFIICEERKFLISIDYGIVDVDLKVEDISYKYK